MDYSNLLKNNLNQFHFNINNNLLSDYAGLHDRMNETKSEFSQHIGYISLFPLFTVDNILFIKLKKI